VLNCELIGSELLLQTPPRARHRRPASAPSTSNGFKVLRTTNAPYTIRRLYSAARVTMLSSSNIAQPIAGSLWQQETNIGIEGRCECSSSLQVLTRFWWGTIVRSEAFVGARSSHIGSALTTRRISSNCQSAHDLTTSAPAARLALRRLCYERMATSQYFFGEHDSAELRLL
jgi:hypothetical protein